MYAASRCDLSSIRVLLRYGADATLKNNQLQNALHQAAFRCSDMEVFTVLLSAGIDIQTKNLWGGDALCGSATYNNFLGISILLDLGAKIDVTDADGDKPLLDAARNASSDSIKVLLERGARYTISNIYGDTILHLAAQTGDLQTLNVTRDANLRSIDPYARNAKGKRAFELAQEGVSKPDGFIDLLLVLLFEIRNRRDYLVGYRRPKGGTRTSGSAMEEISEDESLSHSSETEDFFDAEE